MGLDTRRPPLPAPTDFSTTDNDTTLRDDLATNVSTRTDKTSYSIPEDGTPVTINTAKGIHKKHPSQTSLLIEYFNGGKTEGKVNSRPSVRVRVTPSSKKGKVAKGHLQITEESRTSRKPSYTHHISLGHKSDAAPQFESNSDGSNVSSLPPVEIEVLQNASDLSSTGGRYIPAASDISSMPPDSLLEGTPVILDPGRRGSRSLERTDETVETVETMAQDSLKAPTGQRSRSSSKDRIAQNVMARLAQKPVDGESPKTVETKEIKETKETKVGRDELTPSRKSRHRTSRTSRDEELAGVSGTDSSLLSSNVHRRSGDAQSIRSGVSGVSSINVNNPKLLATVEDAIKRLILPELEALKEEQQTQKNRNKFDHISRDSEYTVNSAETSSSRDNSRRRVSKVSSAPHIHGKGPKIVLNDEVESRGASHKERRSSRGSISERSHADSTRDEERVRKKKSKDRHRDSSHSARDAALAGLAGAGLTAAALRHHDSRESKEDRKERRKTHSRSSRSRATSVSESVESEHRYLKEKVPPLPLLQSELIGSELTRDSILSAETETRERRSSLSSRGTGTETPLREVPRAYASPSPRTPTRTPAAVQRGLGTSHTLHSQTDLNLSAPRSDRSLSSRSREVNSASLEASAAAKARALESEQTHVSQYEIANDPTPTQSPVQSVASYKESINGSPRHLRSVHSPASLSSAGRHAQRPSSRLSIQSFESSPSTKAARTRKRPQGVSLERSTEILADAETPKDVDDFFAQNHEQNEQYRREREMDNSQLESPYLDYRNTQYTDETSEGQYLDQEANVTLDQDIRKLGSNPEYVHTPLAVESAVASLIEPSNISVRSSVSSPLKQHAMSYTTNTRQEHATEKPLHGQDPSQERWGAIRDQAQNLAQSSQGTNSPRQSIPRSMNETPIKMHANALPGPGDMMPAIGFGLEDDVSEVDTNPSIIKGPMGGGSYHDEADELLSRHEERERTPSRSYGKVVAGTAGVAGAAAIAAAAANRVRQKEAIHEDQYQHQVEDDYDQDYPGEQHHYEQQYAYDSRNRTPSRSPAMWKDEGYQSANQHGGITPEFQNRSKLLDDDGLGDYDDEGLDADVFNGKRKHARHISVNSHGMSSPLYDAATGKGIDRIESKDVVALMDHLTVRDAQRNARDTEILVTLVRSAAEMRNQFEDMKHFIRTQDAMIMNTTDKRVDLAEQRIIGGPRPQPLGSPRIPRSSSEDMEVEAKRKNVFKRALRGLSSKGDNDIKNIEKMLIQLLGEVEGLKQTHALTLEQSHSNSLTSYENLRASGDPGYEPEGRAGTASSPNQSGYLSNPSSRRVQDFPSGFDVHQPHRISTVEEDDEEYAEEYENTERMTTPTQEARRNNSISQVTPPQPTKTFRESQSQENTPKRKHKSNSSSIFGIPTKISRWSKTTASTNPESLPRNSGSGEKRPYSSHSRSGSQVNVAYYGDSPYEVREDDRIRSNRSLAREDERSLRSIRSPSPLIPQEEDDEEQYVFEDPKYQAHRNSLNLQHPQPRPGQTGRHQNHLETQAQIFEPSSVGSVGSPDYDQWGSNPSLARNRLSGGGASQGPGNLSPVPSDDAYSTHSAAEQTAAPARPPKIRDDGPLVPQQQTQPLAGHGQTRQMYSSPNEFGSQGALTPLAPIQEVRHSLETDAGHHYSPTPSPRPSRGNLNPASAAAMASPQRKITGPRPMGSRSPSGRAPSGPQQQLSAQGLQAQQQQFERSDTVIRRKPVAEHDIESLESYRSSLDSEIF